MIHEVGRFQVSISPRPTPGVSGPVFDVFVTERPVGSTQDIYVDLREDPRFDVFGWVRGVPTFEVRLTLEHVDEFNARAGMAIQKIGQPTTLLAKASVDRLLEVCERLSKPKKGSKP